MCFLQQIRDTKGPNPETKLCSVTFSAQMQLTSSIVLPPKITAQALVCQLPDLSARASTLFSDFVFVDFWSDEGKELGDLSVGRGGGCTGVKL